MKRDDDKRPDYPDIDGDGDTEEPMADAADDEEELEERKKRDNPRNDRGMPSRMKMNEDEESDEDVVEEVEEIEAGAEINESNDQWYQRNLFENLTKKWAK